MGKMFETIEAGQAREAQVDPSEWQSLVADLSAQNDALLQEVERLEVLCDHDAALHILNRRGLTRALQAEISRVERYGVISSFIYLDLDNFKPINDRYGHEQGDHILKKLAEHINGHLRQSDHFARLGGDEFAIILSYASPAQATDKSVELASSLSKVCSVWGPGAQNLSFSAGVCEIVPGMAASEIIKQADENMYLHKAEKLKNPK